MNEILKMPFGKFKGVNINYLPDWYIEFLLIKFDMNNRFFSKVFKQSSNKFIKLYQSTNYQFFHNNLKLLVENEVYKKYYDSSNYIVDYKVYHLKKYFINLLDNKTELFKFLYNNLNIYYLNYGNKNHYIKTDFVLYDSKTFYPILEVKSNNKYIKKQPNVFYYNNYMDNDKLENTFYNIIEKI